MTRIVINDVPSGGMDGCDGRVRWREGSPLPSQFGLDPTALEMGTGRGCPIRRISIT